MRKDKTVNEIDSFSIELLILECLHNIQKGGDSKLATISTHNGSTFSQRHNRRDRKITDKEKHIDKEGHFEIWGDVDIKKAYSIIFDKAVQEYNENQKRKDRQIKDYYEKIEKDKKKKVGYEMIVGVYGDDSTLEQKKEILREFASNWSKRNKNLVMCGCYFHLDECSKDPHIHITYFPVYRSNKGLKLQNGLDKALEQQGIKCGTSIHETRQILWERRENAYLEMLCNEKGLEVQRSSKTRQHETTREYKLRQSEQEKKELKEKYSELEQASLQVAEKYNQMVAESNQIVAKCNQTVAENEKLRAENKTLKKDLEWERRFDQFTDNEWADDWDSGLHR